MPNPPFDGTSDQASDDASGELARLLEAAARNEPGAFDRAFALLYDELSRLAHAQRGRWRGNETLNTTVLVHEAYVKLAPSAPSDDGGGEGARWSGRRHFFALAARVMRQVLVNYAEQQNAAKRGGGAERVPLEALEGPAGAAVLGDADAGQVLALNRALDRLAQADERRARIVECRFFTGMTIPETAEALGISPATVKREWQAASAWLREEMEGRAG
jgi:RNA polymerase sigma factor (TIGR02999 family)